MVRAMSRNSAPLLATGAALGAGSPVTHPGLDYAGSGLAGRYITPVRAARPAGLPGLDVSSWQGNVDWAAVAAGGARFAYVKATEGTTYVNPYFAQQYVGAHDVGTFTQADARVVLQQPDGQHRGHDADRDVHEEDPVPVDGLREDPPGQQADRRARGGHEAVDADRPRPLSGVRERRHDDAQDHRGGQGTGAALDEPRADQHAPRLRQPAKQRGQREQDQSRDEHAASPDEIAKPSGQ